ADLEGVRVPAGVDGGPGGAHGAAERVGEVLHDGEVLTAHTAATGDHDSGLGELRTGALLLLDAVGDPRGLGGVGDLDLDGLHRGGPGGGLGRNGVGAYGHHGDAAGDLGVGDDGATEDGVLRDHLGGDVHHVGEDTGTQFDGGASGDLLVLGGGRDEDGGGGLVGGELGQQFGLGRHDVVVDLGGGGVDLLRAVLAELGLQLVGGLSHDHRGGLSDAAGRGQQLQRDLLDLSVDVVDEDEDLSHVLFPSLVSPLHELLAGQEVGDLHAA